ncbi:YrdB family protein [Ammoniphilus sp. YIM 78166]|uniref:YrdB family protein n=1 Tax=Ammoniphilus sp. YIM 78166 TaxID=1644106 RepID=UPI0010705399|nr:YrdB family protein [Ammoniphilus sp. YIM 78166]
MMILQMSNIALRFAIELVALGIYGYWAAQIGSTWFSKFLWGLNVPLGIALLWGVFGSPKAMVLLSGGLHMVLELMVFGLPALLLWTVAKPNWAIGYGVVVMLNKVLMTIWQQ